MTDHDAFCEAEYVSEAGGYTSCSCDYRRTRGLVAEHDRQVAERAWDACAASMKYEDGSPVEIVAFVNPYRTKEESNDRA